MQYCKSLFTAFISLFLSDGKGYEQAMFSSLTFLLLTVIVALLICIFHYQRRVHQCHDVIIRLMLEKEKLTQLLTKRPNKERSKNDASKIELISLIDLIKKTLLLFALACSFGGLNDTPETDTLTLYTPEAEKSAFSSVILAGHTTDENSCIATHPAKEGKVDKKGKYAFAFSPSSLLSGLPDAGVSISTL